MPSYKKNSVAIRAFYANLTLVTAHYHAIKEKFIPEAGKLRPASHIRKRRRPSGGLKSAARQLWWPSGGLKSAAR